MAQFLVSGFDLNQKIFSVSGQEAHHLSRVLRKKPGDLIRLFDGQKTVFLGRITRVDSREVQGEIVELRDTDLEKRLLPFEIHLYQALPKGAKWDFVLEKGTELGVSRFVPMLTQYAVPKIAPSDRARKLNRWKKILESAADQCGISRIPEIVEPLSFKDALEDFRNLDPGFSARGGSASGGRRGDVAGSFFPPRHLFGLFAWESLKAPPIWQVLRESEAKPKRFAIFIGPEGGWSQEEAELAQNFGLLPVSLGPTILRTETAPIVAISMLIALTRILH